MFLQCYITNFVIILSLSSNQDYFYYTIHGNIFQLVPLNADLSRESVAIDICVRNGQNCFVELSTNLANYRSENNFVGASK